MFLSMKYPKAYEDYISHLKPVGDLIYPSEEK